MAVSLPHIVALVPQRLRPLSGLDAGFLYLEAAGTPMHIGSLMLLDAPRPRAGGFVAALRAHLSERLPRATALRRTLVPAPLGLGHPLWRDDGDIDLRRHVTTRRLRAPGSGAQLLALVARLHEPPLERDRPLWQFVVIDGLATGQLALYAKTHHALLDGQGGMALARALLDLAPRRARARRNAPARAAAPLRRRDVAAVTARSAVQQLARLLRAVPETMRVARANVVSARRALGSLRESLLIAPRTPFNVQLDHTRRFAIASVPLEAVKRVARAFEVSLNDVVLGLCAASLRANLQREHALPDAALVAAMPVSLRGRSDDEANNQVSMLQCPLATDLDDPVARLHAIATATGQLKQRVATYRNLIPTDFPGFAAPFWATGLSRLWGRGRISERLPALANLVISNVPGPPVELFIAGARISHYYPVSIVTHGLGLNITVQSYATHLEFGVISGGSIRPDPQHLAAGLVRALDDLMARLPA
jgi:WS/DGAT/MGAT family acyltransferase